MEGSQHSTDCDQKSDVKTCWQDEALEKLYLLSCSLFTSLLCLLYWRWEVVVWWLQWVGWYRGYQRRWRPMTSDRRLSHCSCSCCYQTARQCWSVLQLVIVKMKLFSPSSSSGSWIMFRTWAIKLKPYEDDLYRVFMNFHIWLAFKAIMKCDVQIPCVRVHLHFISMAFRFWKWEQYETDEITFFEGG